MVSVPVANTVLAELLFTLDGEGIENTLYFERPAPWTVAEAQQLGNDLISWWVTNMAPSLARGLELTGVDVTDLTGPSGVFQSVSAGGTAIGQINVDTPPNNVSIAISFKTALRGRSFRGRNYIAGFPETAVDKSRLQGAFITQFQAAYQALFPLASASNCVWVVVSRYSGVNPTTGKPIPRAFGVTTEVTQAVFKDNVTDSQRRRLPNH